MGTSQSREMIQTETGEGGLSFAASASSEATKHHGTTKGKFVGSPALASNRKQHHHRPAHGSGVTSSHIAGDVTGEDGKRAKTIETGTTMEVPSHVTGHKVSLSDVRRKMAEERQANRPRITDHQLDTIRATWNIIKRDQRDMGMEMFAKMFATYPNVKEAFSAFRYLSAEDQRFELVLRAHGERVLMIVDQLLLQDSDCRYDVTLLHELGFKHVTFDAKSDYLDLVGQQFLAAIETVMKDNWTPEVEQAWAQFLHFIAYVMREAMVL